MGSIRFKKAVLLAAVPVIPIVLALVYLAVRTGLFLIADYHWYEKIIAFFLLASEIFIFIHGVGYLLEVFHVVIHSGGFQGEDEIKPLPENPPAVAIIVSSYNEPIPVLEKTMTTICNLTYPCKCIYFLDDTRYDLPGSDTVAMADYRNAVDSLCRRLGVYLFRRKWHGAKAGMINDFLGFLGDSFLDGYEFFNYGNSDYVGQEEYIAIFDADQNPIPGFLDPLVARMEAEDDLAFIQTPQYYTNSEKNRVARAAGLQQVVFHEYICEGKSLKESIFCCGTNVLFRVKALQDVEGFDTASVTEDFATSLKLHFCNWRSSYQKRVMAFGMGPEDLGAYFKQQFRWALGTVGILRKMIGLLLRQPRKMSLLLWWEYFLSGTYYFIGYVHFIFMICPLIYLFVGVPTYFTYPEIYLIFFMPYFMISLSVFFWTLQKRGYRFSEIMQGQLLSLISFPVHIKASTLGLLGTKGKFVVTPKGKKHYLPLYNLWPQVGLALLQFSGFVWGLLRLYFEREPFGALAINTLWSFIFFLLLSSILYFNHYEESAA